eukprot:scaffold2475_cov29-Tisochrysis_lutea.AAC.2
MAAERVVAPVEDPVVAMAGAVVEVAAATMVVRATAVGSSCGSFHRQTIEADNARAVVDIRVVHIIERANDGATRHAEAAAPVVQGCTEIIALKSL